MRSSLLAILAAATLVGMANGRFPTASSVAFQTTSSEQHHLFPTPTPRPAIAFRPGSGLPGGRYRVSEHAKASGTADSGEIYEPLTPGLYEVETITKFGTTMTRNDGEALFSTSKIRHDVLPTPTPPPVPSPTPDPHGGLVLYKNVVTGKYCWDLVAGDTFTPAALPSPDVWVVIKSNDGTVTVVTKNACYPQMPLRGF